MPSMDEYCHCVKAIGVPLTTAQLQIGVQAEMIRDWEAS